MSQAGKRPIYDIADLHISEIEGHPNGLADLMERRVDGMVIREVYPPEAMEAVLQRIQSADFGADQYTITFEGDEKEYPSTLPRTLVNSYHHLAEYHDMAARWRPRLKALFEGYGDFEARVAAIFAAMGGGRPAEVACGGEDELYVPSTVRFLRPGTEIALHVGEDLLMNLPENERIRRLLDCSAQLSFFIVLQAPEAGGALTLFSLQYQDTAQGKHVQGLPLWFAINAYDHMDLNPRPGDMILFDGGRIYHEVSTVKGPRQRVTLGGFVALSKDHDRYLYWS